MYRFYTVLEKKKQGRGAFNNWYRFTQSYATSDSQQKYFDHGNIPLPSLELSDQVILGPIWVDPGLFAVPRLLDRVLADKVLDVCCQLTHLQTRRL